MHHVPFSANPATVKGTTSMRIILIGATGTIGGAVANILSARHEVISASRSGDIRVDLSDPRSISAMYEKVGKIDAIVSAAGSGAFGPLDALTDEDFAFGLGNKLMGQVNLVRIGSRYINDNGSFTLTSGVLAQEPMPGSVSISMANAALEGFTRAAALELADGQRVNTVSPVFVRETMEMMGMDSAWGMPAAQVAYAYKTAVEGDASGTVLSVRDHAQAA